MKRLFLFFFLLILAALIGIEGEIELFGNVIFYELTSGEGIPLIVVGDGPGLDSRYLRGMLSDRQILFYDQLGSGQSANKTSQILNLEYYLCELATLVEKLSLNKFHLMGHGFGGAVAVAYTLANPPGLVSLTLVNPLLNFPATEAALAKAVEPEGADQTDKFNLLLGEYREDLPAALVESLARLNRDSYRAVWGEDETQLTGTMRGVDLSPSLGDVKVPTLLCAGLHSFPPIEHISRYQESLSESEFVIFMNSAHFPMLEEKSVFEAVVGDFLPRAETRSEEAVSKRFSKTGEYNLGAIALEESDEGESFVLEVDQDLEIFLRSSPGIGYCWEVGSYDDSVVKLLSEPFYETEHSGSIYQVFSFRGIKSGKTEIALSYRSRWKDEPLKTYTVEVAIPQREVPTVRLNEKNSSETFSVGLGIPIEVSLPVTTGTGMSWRITATSPSILRQIKENEYRVPDNTPQAGGKIEQVYYFEGINYGTAFIEFSYGRPWDDLNVENTFGATVTVGEPVQRVCILNEKDNNGTFELELDQTLLIKLKNSLADGGAWRLQSKIPSQLVLVAGPLLEEAESVTYSVFYFKLVEKGEGALEIFYSRPGAEPLESDALKLNFSIS